MQEGDAGSADPAGLSLKTGLGDQTSWGCWGPGTRSNIQGGGLWLNRLSRALCVN